MPASTGAILLLVSICGSAVGQYEPWSSSLAPANPCATVTPGATTPLPPTYHPPVVKAHIVTTSSQWGGGAASGNLYAPQSVHIVGTPAPAPYVPAAVPTPAPTSAPTLAPTLAPAIIVPPAPITPVLPPVEGDRQAPEDPSAIGYCSSFGCKFGEQSKPNAERISCPLLSALEAPTTPPPEDGVIRMAAIAAACTDELCCEAPTPRTPGEGETEFGSTIGTSTETPQFPWWEEHKTPVIVGGVIGTAVLGGTIGAIAGVTASNKNKREAAEAAAAATTPLPRVLTSTPPAFLAGNFVQARVEEEQRDGSSASSWSAPSSESSSGDTSSGSSIPIWLLVSLLACLLCCCIGIPLAFYLYRTSKKKKRSTRDNELKAQMQAQPPTYVETPPPQIATEQVPLIQAAPVVETVPTVVETAAPMYTYTTAAPVVESAAPMYTYTTAAPVVEYATAAPVVEYTSAAPAYTYTTGEYTAPTSYLPTINSGVEVTTAAPATSGFFGSSVSAQPTVEPAAYTVAGGTAGSASGGGPSWPSGFPGTSSLYANTATTGYSGLAPATAYTGLSAGTAVTTETYYGGPSATTYAAGAPTVL